MHRRLRNDIFKQTTSLRQRLETNAEEKMVARQLKTESESAEHLMRTKSTNLQTIEDDESCLGGGGERV